MCEFTTLQTHDVEFLEAVRHGTGCKIWEFHPQKLANAVWTIAMLQVHDIEWLEAVRRGAMCLILEFSQKKLAHTV